MAVLAYVLGRLRHILRSSCCRRVDRLLDSTGGAEEGNLCAPAGEAAAERAVAKMAAKPLPNPFAPLQEMQQEQQVFVYMCVCVCLSVSLSLSLSLCSLHSDWAAEVSKYHPYY